MAVDFFLKLAGINGESSDEHHKDEIQVMSWSWGASNMAQIGVGTGSSAGKASISELSIMKSTDAASSTLLKSLLLGTHIKTGTLAAVKASGDSGGKPFLTYDMTEMFVTSYQISGSSEVPMESVSFSFKTIKQSYFKQDTAGALAKAGDVTYDLMANKTS